MPYGIVKALRDKTPIVFEEGRDFPILLVEGLVPLVLGNRTEFVQYGETSLSRAWPYDDVCDLAGLGLALPEGRVTKHPFDIDPDLELLLVGAETLHEKKFRSHMTRPNLVPREIAEIRRLVASHEYQKSAEIAHGLYLWAVSVSDEAELLPYGWSSFPMFGLFDKVERDIKEFASRELRAIPRR